MVANTNESMALRYAPVEPDKQPHFLWVTWKTRQTVHAQGHDQQFVRVLLFSYAGLASYPDLHAYTQICTRSFLITRKSEVINRSTDQVLQLTTAKHCNATPAEEVCKHIAPYYRHWADSYGTNNNRSQIQTTLTCTYVWLWWCIWNPDVDVGSPFRPSMTDTAIGWLRKSWLTCQVVTAVPRKLAWLKPSPFICEVQAQSGSGSRSIPA